MHTAIHSVLFIIPWMLIAAGYATLGTMTYVRVNTMLYRLTDMGKNDAQNMAIWAGLLFWIAVPITVIVRYMGLIDPNTRAAKASNLRMEQLERDKNEADARASAERAKLQEDLALRARERLEGAEIPYTPEERLALEEREATLRRSQIHNEKAALEIEQKRSTKSWG